MKILSQLHSISIQKSITITTAESCTGGILSAWLTELPGSSAFFESGFITYSNSAKRRMLGVSQRSLDQFGAVSEQVAREMAIGAKSNAHATLSIAISGIAGPGGSEQKPEGRVCFALSTAQDTHAETVEFGALGREAIRQSAATHALRLLLQAATSY